MDLVVLIFPDKTSLKDFECLIESDQYQVDASGEAIHGLFREREIELACNAYNAKVRNTSTLAGSRR
jgi:hypothetical protein